MELTINYAIKAAITLTLLYLLYYSLLRNQVSFRFNRAYLLLTPLVAVLFPMLEWQAVLPAKSAVGEMLQSIQLDEVIVTAYQPNAEQAQSNLININNILTTLYILGALFFLLKLVRQLRQIQQLKTQAVPLQDFSGKAQVYQLPKLHAAFAFGKTIFLGKADHLTTTDRDKILSHELAHVQLHHTWDILYYEILTALLWFHPIVWLLKQELRDVHEYQADAKVLQQFQPEEYSALLSREVLQQMGIPIGSYFQKPQVLKRLQMLELNGQPSGWFRHLLLLPALGTLLVAFSLQADAQVPLLDMTQQENITSSVSEQDHPAESNAMVTPELSPDASPEIGQVSEQTILPERPVQEDAKPAPSFTDVRKDVEPAAATEEKPYTFVQQMPQFEGGDTELLKYLARNIRYPDEAQQKGAEGLVVVGFTVNKDGSLEDIRVLRSIEESIDAEALRVVEQMNGMWTAGKQNGRTVRVNYTLPVKFDLK